MDAHRKVMFVDDEEGVRRSWNRYLSDAGFEVTTAEDGDKAIRRLQEDPADVVVADLKMPGANGVELLRWLHDEQPDTRFILLTGYGNEEVERQVRELGAFEYLEKPVSPDVLSAVVTAAMIRDQRRKAAESKEVAEPAEAVATAGEAEHLEVAEPTAAVADTVPLEAETAAIRAAKAVIPERRSGFRTVAEVAGWLVAAPILGLAFVVFLPVIGFGALLWTLGGLLGRESGSSPS